jgi:hypothetical protein
LRLAQSAVEGPLATNQMRTSTKLEEAVEFRESKDSADYWESMEEAAFEVDLHRNLLHPRLVVLTHRPDYCPRCQNDLDDVVIEYVVWNNRHLVVIRDVPALRCCTGHEYILENTLDRIEHLLGLEEAEKLHPTETIQVPVFSLKTSA